MDGLTVETSEDSETFKAAAEALSQLEAEAKRLEQGLANARKIVEQHNGTITVGRKRGKGGLFVILVLFLFVVMMLNLGRATLEQERKWLGPLMWAGPTLLLLVLLAEIAYLLTVAESPSQGWTDASQGITVTGSAISKLVFTTPARTAMAGVVTSVLTVQAQDAYGNPASVTAATRFSTPSFKKMLLMWYFTVDRLTYSRSAISAWISSVVMARS